MSENEIAARLASLERKLSQIYDALMGSADDYSHKPGLLSECRTRRIEFDSWVAKIRNIETEVSELTSYKRQIMAWCTVGFVLLTVSWEIAKATILK